jgi:hypothetical protein
MILWHVDDLKVSHMDKKVVEGVLKLLNSDFGKETPLSVTHGKVHDYLGMHYTVPGKVLEHTTSVLQFLPAFTTSSVLTSYSFFRRAPT